VESPDDNSFGTTILLPDSTSDEADSDTNIPNTSNNDNSTTSITTADINSTTVLNSTLNSNSIFTSTSDREDSSDVIAQESQE